MLRSASCLAVFALLASTAQAVEIETVPVGHKGNTGELSGDGAGGFGSGGPTRLCGAVDYDYNIGKYEVTAGQYRDFLNAVAGVDTYGLYNTRMWYDSSAPGGCKIERYAGNGTADDPYQYRVAADYANRPVNYVSWGDAARFANWLHNGQPTGILTGNPVQDAELTENGAYDINGAVSWTPLLAITRQPGATWVIPTEDEWYKAAYHKNDGVTDNYFDYPTSSDSVPDYVNDSGNLSGTGTPFTEGGTDPGNYATYDGDGGVDGTGSPYYLTEVGEWEHSVSRYGTFDQGGNVWEWNEEILGGTRRGVRGGSFVYSGGYHLHAAYRGYTDAGPLDEKRDVGFRVASIPEPGSSTLLVCGLVAGLMWWRRRK